MIRPDIRAALLDSDYRRHIDEALARLAELEGEAATAIWAASLTCPLYEDPPERWNAWTGDLIIESWESRAARLLTYRMWRLEETQNEPDTPTRPDHRGAPRVPVLSEMSAARKTSLALALDATPKFLGPRAEI